MNWKRLKKFSTATLLFALAALTSPLGFAATSSCEFSEQAPDQHLVVAGDTLWEIAALFLKNPWCWPQVWEENRASIRDPHWIYPGQTIYFKRAQGQLSIAGLAEAQSGLRHATQPDHHLTPRIRSEALAKKPLPLLAPSLQTLMAQAPLLQDSPLPASPSIVAIADGHAMAGRHDTVFVTGELGPHTVFTVLRAAEPVTDPDSRRILAYSVVQTATLSLLQSGTSAGEPHRFTVAASSAEIRPGDALIPSAAAAAAGDLPATPHPAVALDGRIAAVLRGSRWANQYDVVAINRGRQHGLDAGSVLGVWKHVRISAHDSGNQALERTSVKLPAQQIGTLLVFRVSAQAALALVLRASDGIGAGDMVHAPELR